MSTRPDWLASSVQPWLLLWLTVVLAALCLTALVMADGVPEEASLMREVQGWAVPGAGVSGLVRAATSTEAVLVAGALIAVVHWLARDRMAAVVLVAVLVLLPVTQAGLKEVVDRPRPPEVDARIEARAGFTSPSYPAGHVMSPTVVYGWAIFVLLMSPRSGASEPGALTRDRSHITSFAVRSERWRVWGRRTLALGLLALLGLSGIVNVQLGVHWPTDVLGGYIWGAVLLMPALAVYSCTGQAR